MIRVRQKYIIQTKKKCFVVSLWLLPMVSILANFGDFRDFRDFRLSDTSFLIENGLFFLIREIPKFFSNLFYTQSTPRFQSTIRNFQNQPCMTPPTERDCVSVTDSWIDRHKATCIVRKLYVYGTLLS